MRKIFSFCGPYLQKYRWRIIVLVLLFITVSLASVLLSYITGCFVDALITAEAVKKLEGFIASIAVLALVEFVLSYICERLYIIIQCRSGHALNTDAIHHIQNLPYSYMQGRNATFLNQQINNDSNAAVIFCITVLQNIISNGLTLLLPLVLITYMEPWLGVAMFCVNLVYFALFRVFKGPLYRAQHSFLDEQANYFSKLGIQLSNVKFIQTHGLAKTYIARLTRSLQRLLRSALRLQKTQYGFGGSDVIMKYTANILVFVLGGQAVIQGRMSVGDFTIVLSYFSMSLSATQYFFSLGREIQSAHVSCDRLQAIFDEREQTNGEQKLTDIEKIECSDINFRYGDEPILSGLSATFHKGCIYAFVGENGAGKSTLINLLLGLFADEYEGMVCYDGIPIEKIDMRSVRLNLVGVSEQEPMLLEETLRFNLTFDDDAIIDLNELQSLCKLLNLVPLMDSLPNGLETIIREGTSNLSGGEKQKLSIIRALLKHPKLLVLDEPTSALDRESRMKFIDYLHTNAQDKIVFISTHDEELLQICTETIRLSRLTKHEVK